MEFTRLLKYGSAALFLILLAHGLVLGFSLPTTIISIALLLVCFLMEQKLVLHEREMLNTKFNEKLTELVIERNEMEVRFVKEQDKLQQKLDAVHSQLNTLKTGIGMRKL